MYRVIQPIVENSFYKLDLNITPSIDDIRHLVQFNCSQFSCKRFLHLINYDLKNRVGLLLNIISFQSIIELVIRYDFLHNYWSHDNIQHLLIRSRKRFRIKIKNGEDFTDELINLTNMFNLRYNFTDKFFFRRLSRYKFAKDYYLGTSMALYLSLRTQTCSSNFVIYPKNQKIDLTDFVNDSGYESMLENSEYLIVINREYTAYIYKYYYSTLAQIMMKSNEYIIVDGDNIWAKPEIYQLLDTDESYIMQHLNIPCDIDVSNAIPYTYTTKIISAAKMPNIKTSICYICKKSYDSIYNVESYHSMCLECGLYNYDKRCQQSDLTGVVALVTGIRQKIGLATALKLLRCGAKVIGTTRYPRATWYNYSKQSDFDDWRDRLIIYRCDFLNIIEVNKFVEFCKSQSISVLILNACQTIQPSPIYRSKLLQLENILSTNCIDYNVSDVQTIMLANNRIQELVPYHNYNQCIERIILNHNIEINTFLDVQDINIKLESSWNMTLPEISATEIMEATIINQLVPTLIVNQLRPFMVKPTFIIACTALEGTFDEKIEKNSKHAHTNMCKAAMNMMILTMSKEKDSDLHVYSINPGFVSGVNANPSAVQYPLLPEDGAARILDPIIQYYNKTPLPNDWINLRNYQPVPW